jgi:hypothetical protein
MESILSIDKNFVISPYATLLSENQKYYTGLFYYLRHQFRMIIDEPTYSSLSEIKGIRQESIVYTSDFYNRKTDNPVVFIGSPPPLDWFEMYGGVTVLAADLAINRELWQYIDTLFLICNDLSITEELLEFLAYLCGLDGEFSVVDVEEQSRCVVFMLKRSLVSVYLATPKDSGSNHKEFTFMTRYGKLFCPPQPLVWAKDCSLKDEKLRKYLSTYYKVSKINPNQK